MKFVIEITSGKIVKKLIDDTEVLKETWNRVSNGYRLEEENEIWQQLESEVDYDDYDTALNDLIDAIYDEDIYDIADAIKEIEDERKDKGDKEDDMDK